MNEMNPAWLEQALKGNPEAYEQVLERYQTPVFNLCYRMLGDADEAEDAAQETFLRAFQYRARYDRSRSFSTWLLSIAAHYCIDQIRKRRMRLVSLDTSPDGDPDNAPYFDPPDPGLGPERSTVQAEEQRQIQALLARLGPQDRAAVVMLYWYEMSYEEIAEALDMTVSAVKSRLHRARQALADGWLEQEARPAAERSQDGKVHSPAF